MKCTLEDDAISLNQAFLQTRVQFQPITYTVEPPNKGHFGDNINSAVMSFVERLSSRRRFKMY